LKWNYRIICGEIKFWCYLVIWSINMTHLSAYMDFPSFFLVLSCFLRLEVLAFFIIKNLKSTSLLQPLFHKPLLYLLSSASLLASKILLNSANAHKIIIDSESTSFHLSLHIFLSREFSPLSLQVWMYHYTCT
jgi:hypothetical protein